MIIEFNLLVKSTGLPKLINPRFKDFNDEIPPINSRILELLIWLKLKSRTSRLVNIESFSKPVKEIELVNNFVQTSRTEERK